MMLWEWIWTHTGQLSQLAIILLAAIGGLALIFDQLDLFGIKARQRRAERREDREERAREATERAAERAAEREADREAAERAERAAEKASRRTAGCLDWTGSRESRRAGQRF